MTKFYWRDKNLQVIQKITRQNVTRVTKDTRMAKLLE